MVLAFGNFKVTWHVFGLFPPVTCPGAFGVYFKGGSVGKAFAYQKCTGTGGTLGDVKFNVPRFGPGQSNVFGYSYYKGIPFIGGAGDGSVDNNIGHRV